MIAKIIRLADGNRTQFRMFTEPYRNLPSTHPLQMSLNFCTELFHLVLQLRQWTSIASFQFFHASDKLSSQPVHIILNGDLDARKPLSSTTSVLISFSVRAAYFSITDVCNLSRVCLYISFRIFSSSISWR